MRPLFLLIFFTLFITDQIVAQESVDSHEEIFFATASAELDQASLEKLDALIDQINKLGDYRLDVSAYTDSRGSNSYNDKLARARAKSVQDYLEAKYIATDQMEVISFGESLAGNDLSSEEQLQKNRRVDINVQGWMWGGLSSIQDSLRQPLVQKYSIDAQKDELLTGARDGNFFIENNSFVDADGETIEGQVDIELIECYSLGDMISLGLTTTAQERLLESGGMFKISASANGEDAYLREGASITASVPTNNYRQDMSLFYSADHTDENSTEMDWENTEASVNSKMPRLRLAPGPSRPDEYYYAIKYLSVDTSSIDDIVGQKKPVYSGIDRPRKPREPNYDRIAYRPRGMKKLFTSKDAVAERTEQMRNDRRERHERNVTRYETRQVDYRIAIDKHSLALDAYKEKKASIIDERNMLVEGTWIYDRQKARADSAYAFAKTRYERDIERYKKYKERKLNLYEQKIEAMGGADKATFERYFLAVNQLGWANIDRFLKTVSTTMLAAQDEDLSTGRSAMVFLLIPERNIILRMKYANEGGFNLSRVPVGEEARIIAVKVTGQKAYISNEAITITEDMTVDLDFQPGRLKDIRMALADL